MLLVRTKVFMELIEKVTKVDLENKQLHKDLQELKQAVVLLKKKDGATASKEEDEDENMSDLIHEIMHGVPDNLTGKVRLTDGTE